MTGIATTVMPTFDVLKPAAAEPIAAIVRTIFAQRDHATAIAHLRKVVDGLRRGFRKAAGLLGRRPRTSSRIAGLPVSTSASCTARTCSSGSTNRSSRGERRRHLSVGEVDPALIGALLPGKTRNGRSRSDATSASSPLGAFRAGLAAERPGALGRDRVADQCGRVWEPLCGFPSSGRRRSVRPRLRQRPGCW